MLSSEKDQSKCHDAKLVLGTIHPYNDTLVRIFLCFQICVLFNNLVILFYVLAFERAVLKQPLPFTMQEQRLVSV